MATASWSTRIRQDSDAEFRLWGSELSSYFATVGLVQTADTGQIDWVTVTRAATNSIAGYEIWRFDDAAQATAPIFMRVEYGSASGVTQPRVRIGVGTGSDGSGTLTGLTTTINVINGNANQTSPTARQSYLSYNEGFLGLSWKTGAGQTEGAFFVCRTCDPDGVPTTTGAMVHWGSGSTASFTARQALRFSAPATAFGARTTTSSAALGLNPQSVTETDVDGDIQVFLGWTITPRASPLFGVCGVLSAELAIGGTFQATLVGTTPRTYLTMTNTFGAFGDSSAGSSGGLNTAILWE